MYTKLSVYVKKKKLALFCATQRSYENEERKKKMHTEKTTKHISLLYYNGQIRRQITAMVNFKPCYYKRLDLP